MYFFSSNMRFLLIGLLVIMNINISSQEIISSFDGHQGDFYMNWGYNRAFFNESDIHFQGKGYDFTIYDVEAKDLPETFNTKVYFNVKKISIPQFNFRIGYYLTDRLSLSIGSDHMKYVMSQNQIVKIEGTIDKSLSETYGGEYHGERITLSDDFLRYEHTNGFNFVRVGLEYRTDIWQSANTFHNIVAMPGINIGPVLPWTNYTFLNERHSDLFHLGGFGFSASSAFRYEFKNTGFFQIQAQYGFSHLSRVLLEDRSGDYTAKQNIVFFERSFALGVYLHSFNKHKKK